MAQGCWSVVPVCATSYSWTTGPHRGAMESPQTPQKALKGTDESIDRGGVVVLQQPTPERPKLLYYQKTSQNRVRQQRSPWSRAVGGQQQLCSSRHSTVEARCSVLQSARAWLLRSWQPPLELHCLDPSRGAASRCSRHHLLTVRPTASQHRTKEHRTPERVQLLPPDFDVKRTSRGPPFFPAGARSRRCRQAGVRCSFALGDLLVRTL